MYRYRVRPGYQSSELLIEFIKGAEHRNFISDLKKALSHISVRRERTDDIWINDEVLYYFSCSEGKFMLSKHIWGFAFILADENQKCIEVIDKLLSDNKKFKRQEVDFKEFQ